MRQFKPTPLSIAAALVLLTACSRNSLPENVSLIQLISAPERFDGKFIRVVGYVRVEFEGNAIYFHQEDYAQFIPANGLWLDSPPCFKGAKHDEPFTSGYALVVGTFIANRPHELSIWSGRISHISLCTPYPSLAEMEEKQSHGKAEDLHPKP
jgi:hypothetical protein